MGQDSFEEEEDELAEDHSSALETYRPPKKATNVKPKGKLIAFDAVNIPKGDKTQIDKFLSYRQQKDGTEEILVKYKHMAYHTCEWLKKADLDNDKNFRLRVKRFLDKPSWDTQYSDDEPFNPNYLKIDRIIDDGELDGELHFLVKWVSLGYDQATWESASVVRDMDAEKEDEFYNNKILTQEKKQSYYSKSRTTNGRWQQLKASPVYKGENTLRAYQLEGLNWLMYCWHKGQNSILADEMGLGKTVQSTVFLYQLYRKEKVMGPFLVVVPLSTMGNWEREIRTWTDMNLVCYHGNAQSRNLIVETEFYYRNDQGHLIPGIFKFDVLLTTYEMVMSGAAHLRPVPWKCVVLDEAHRLKNKTSKISEFLKSYQMDHRVLLTGTPLQNSLDELWALLNFLEPEKFASEKSFIDEYGNMNSAADVERLQSLLKPLMLRRLKEDVEKSIPVKEETVVEVELTTTQKKWYRSILEKNFSWLKQGTKRSNVPQLINTMIELRKCCIHPWLLNGAEDQILDELNATTNDEHAKALIQSSGKMVLIDKLLRKLKKGGHKVLIFSQMTKCLDLIQDYLRHQKWGFERIDGGVRGDQRQAAIDRFSTEGSDSFVFLLCTRAGGVGINLTAADTCIIFDSDWNPQNDLQAQSRCHRIGQKKSVKIYRLITRNTYEREMFDRASMKLGLDKALLQRMDTSDSGSLLGSSKPPSSLSKQEIEQLLKKGAYGAFMDDESSNQFCEEDIDQILERRTTVIRHDNPQPSEKGSIFSKASFQAEGTHSVDVNDPDFWDKVAKEAELDIVEDIPEELLILDVPRNRKQRTRYGQEQNPEDSEPDSDNTTRSRPSDLKTWSLTDRNRLERALMQHGFGNWKMIQEAIPRRSIVHLRSVSRWLLMRALRTCTNVEKEVALDVKRQLALYGVPQNLETAEFEPGPIDVQEDEFEPDAPEIPESDMPYPGADDREHFECISFFKEAHPDYLDHLEKKAKNLLIRVALMYNIRHRFNPNPNMHMPKLLGSAPAPWWGSQEDKELMIGLCRYGYLQYYRVWADPELSFAKKFNLLEKPVGQGDPNKPEGDEGENPEDEMEIDVAEDIPDDTEQEVIEDVKTEPKLEQEQPTEAVTENGQYAIPGATELGVRIRRIVAALAKYRLSLARREKSGLAKEDKVGQRSRDYFTKKHKQDFQRVLLSFGVVRKPNSTTHDWDVFRGLADLVKKSDEAMEDYYQKVVRMSEEVLALENPANKAAQAPLDDAETLTLDRAKKILRRIEYFNKLRDEVIPDPKLTEKIMAVRRHGKGTMPKWWTFELDESLLYGLARFGANRYDLIVQEPDLSFHAVHEEFLQSVEQRKRDQVPADQLVNGKFEEKFWMRESVALKRMEILVNACLKPSKPKKKDDEMDSDTDTNDLSSSVLSKTPRFKIRLPPPVPSSDVKTQDEVDDGASSSGDTDDLLAASERIGQNVLPPLHPHDRHPSVLPPIAMEVMHDRMHDRMPYQPMHLGDPRAQMQYQDPQLQYQDQQRHIQDQQRLHLQDPQRHMQDPQRMHLQDPQRMHVQDQQRMHMGDPNMDRQMYMDRTLMTDPRLLHDPQMMHEHMMQQQMMHQSMMEQSIIEQGYKREADPLDEISKRVKLQ
ncbi:SNF2 family N-terminal domain-containing protein [Gorgonomyces haynaldii]|nr:SNF2 family N-terminal domain-containing protein [Gorgonomyces haynaldii]